MKKFYQKMWVDGLINYESKTAYFYPHQDHIEFLQRRWHQSGQIVPTKFIGPKSLFLHKLDQRFKFSQLCTVSILDYGFTMHATHIACIPG